MQELKRKLKVFWLSLSIGKILKDFLNVVIGSGVTSILIIFYFQNFEHISINPEEVVHLFRKLFEYIIPIGILFLVMRNIIHLCRGRSVYFCKEVETVFSCEYMNIYKKVDYDGKRFVINVKKSGIEDIMKVIGEEILKANDENVTSEGINTLEFEDFMKYIERIEGIDVTLSEVKK